MNIPNLRGRMRFGWRSRQPKPRYKAGRQGLSWLLLLPAFFLALLIGAVAGLDSPILLMLLTGPIFATLVFFLVNAQGLLLSLFVVTFLIQGSALYFLGLRQATWIAVGMAILFFVRTVMDLMVSKVRRTTDTRVRHSAIIGALGAYALCFLVSTIFNRPSAGQLIASIKSIWPMFSVLLAMYWICWTPERLAKLWWTLLVIAMLQLPVVLYQHFFVAARRFGAFDSVVGTFGGTPLGGGLSSILVFFIICMMTYVLACWNRGLMGRTATIVICLVGMAIIMMGEVKAAFIWLPLSVFFVLRKRAMKNIASLIVYVCMAAMMLGSIYFVYNQLYWGDGQSKAGTLTEKLDASGGYFFDVHNLNYQTGEISRGASLALWVNDHSSSMSKRVFGYGPGASKSGSLLGTGELAQRFAPLHIDATALAVLLWEVGLAGTLAYCGMLFLGIFAGWRFVVAGQGSPAQLAGVETSIAMLLLFASLLFYNRSLMDEPTAQLLCMFCLGYVVQTVRFGPAAAAVTPVAPPRSRARRF